MIEALITEIVQKAVQHVPTSIRETEAARFRESLCKEATSLGEPLTPWGESVLRKMGEQFTVFQGQAGTKTPEKGER